MTTNHRLLHPALPPLEAECRFLDPLDDLHTTLTVAAILPQVAMTLTVLLEHAQDVEGFDICGVAGSIGPIEVADGETLTFLCRHAGQIVACGVYEIDCHSPHLLVPRACSNLFLDVRPVGSEADLHQQSAGDESGARA